MQELVEEVLAMRGLISEPARSTIARRFALMISAQVKQRTPNKYAAWIRNGIPEFLRKCEVAEIPEGWVPNRLEVETTKLAEFCNRWLQVEAFRKPGEGEWTPITADMNSLRVTMVNELKVLADAQ